MWGVSFCFFLPFGLNNEPANVLNLYDFFFVVTKNANFSISSLLSVSPAISTLCLMCCCPSQVDRLWDPPLLCPQHGGPRGSGDHHVPQLLCRLLHHGWHRRGVLHGPVPSGGPDGPAWRPPHVHDHHSPGVTAAAGPAQL